MMAALEAARDALAAIAGVASCKIGLEANISPASYPLIRLVPARITPGRPYGNRTAEVLIYRSDTLEMLANRMHQAEHSLLVQSLLRLIVGDDEEEE